MRCLQRTVVLPPMLVSLAFWPEGLSSFVRRTIEILHHRRGYRRNGALSSRRRHWMKCRRSSDVAQLYDLVRVIRQTTASDAFPFPALLAQGGLIVILQMTCKYYPRLFPLINTDTLEITIHNWLCSEFSVTSGYYSKTKVCL